MVAGTTTTVVLVGLVVATGVVDEAAGKVASVVVWMGATEAMEVVGWTITTEVEGVVIPEKEEEEEALPAVRLFGQSDDPSENSPFWKHSQTYYEARIALGMSGEGLRLRSTGTCRPLGRRRRRGHLKLWTSW